MIIRIDYFSCYSFRQNVQTGNDIVCFFYELGIICLVRLLSQVFFEYVSDGIIWIIVDFIVGLRMPQ
jgi:hypothetical protein